MVSELNFIFQQELPEKLVNYIKKECENFNASAPQCGSQRLNVIFLDLNISPLSILNYLTQTKATEWKPFYGITLDPQSLEQLAPPNERQYPFLPFEAAHIKKRVSVVCTFDESIRQPSNTDSTKDDHQKLPTIAFSLWNKNKFETTTPCLFLDRDGIVNIDNHYPHKIEQAILQEKIIDIIALAKAKQWKVVILTNQAGIAKGYYKHKDLFSFNQHLHEQLEKQNAAPDAWFHCPHHPDGKIDQFRKNCFCRKPMPGMALYAAYALNIDLSKSIMIGDKISDRLELPYLKSFLIQGQYDTGDSDCFSSLSELSKHLAKLI